MPGKRKTELKEIGVVNSFTDLMKKEVDDRRVVSVCAMWELCPPEYSKSWGASLVSVSFLKGLKRLGWKENTDGAFKSVFVNGNLVLKFLFLQSDKNYINNGMDKEWNMWRRGSMQKKKHLAPCLMYYKWRLLFQQKVPEGNCKSIHNCKPAEVLARKYRIKDWKHNHGHVKNGRTVFFDYSF